MDLLYLWIMLALAGACLHIAIKKYRTKDRIIEVLLLYLLVFQVGFGSIWGFMGHAFMADNIASYIGWPTGSPFQFEVAVANLSYGILGVLCARYRGNFWAATIVAFSTFYWGAAYGHIVDMLENSNYAPGNIGAPLYLDVVLPVVLLVLLISLRGAGKRQTQTLGLS